MRPRRHLARAGRTVVLTVLALAVLAGCQRRDEPAPEIRIGFLADMPTPIAEATLDAARLAVAEINQAGGIEVAGRRQTVEMLVEDTEGTPEGAVRASLKLINLEEVVAVIGSSFSRNAIPSGEVAERAGIPMICPASTHPQTTAAKQFVFRVAFVDPLQGSVMARFAREELGLETVAVLYDQAETYSRGIAERFRQVFDESGEVVAFEPFTTGETDFSDQLDRIRAAMPDGLFLPNFSREVILQGRQARHLGVDAVLLGSDGWLVHGLENHEPLEGAFFSQGWHPDIAHENAAAQRFVTSYERAYGRSPDEPAALTYDAFGLLFAALAGAAHPEPGAIREALSEIEGFGGVTGPITYRGQGGDPRKNVSIVKIENGEIRLFKVIEPRADAPPAG